MASKQFFSGVATLAPSQLTNSQTSITGASTATWSASGDYIVRIDGFAPGTSTAIFEDVLVTANNQGTGVLTVTRAQDGTNGQAFAAGATLTPVVTLKMITDAFPRIDVSSAQAFTGPITVPPSGSLAVPTTSYGSFMVKLDDILVGTDTRYLAATSQITFLNTSGSGTNVLPTGFRHLMIEWYTRGDTAAANTTILLQLNNDTAANYDWQRLAGSAAVASAAESLGATSIKLADIPAATATANYFGQGEARLKYYQGAVGNKIVVANHAYATANTSGTTEIGSFAGKWRTTATPVTRLDLKAGAGNFIVGSLFTLWALP